MDTLTVSMIRTSTVCDNTVMEPFFSTLKTERAYRRHYPTRNAARADGFDYIERGYDRTSRHATSENISAIAFARTGAVG